MIETTDTVIVGIVLLLILPSLFVEFPASRRGGYNAAFWRLELEDKLDHIAREPGHWTRMGIVWLPNIVLAAAGMTAFTYQLSTEGEGTLGFVALGAFLIGSVAWLIGALVQTAVVRRAAAVRAESGRTPSWLQPFWDAAWWSEIVYVTATNAAFVVWGIAMLSSGFPAEWMGWAAIGLGALALAMIAFAREAFPHLGIIVPIVLGVALIVS